MSPPLRIYNLRVLSTASIEYLLLMDLWRENLNRCSRCFHRYMNFYSFETFILYFNGSFDREGYSTRKEWSRKWSRKSKVRKVNELVRPIQIRLMGFFFFFFESTFRKKRFRFKEVSVSSSTSNRNNNFIHLTYVQNIRCGKSMCKFR